MRTAVSASIWPISTPTLKLTMLVTSPFEDRVNSCSLVARPKPWNRPKTSTATFVFGRTCRTRSNPPRFSNALYATDAPDHGVDEVRVGLNPSQHPGQQRDAVADREQADVEHHVLEPVEKEDHPDQEQDVVVAGDHVLRAEVQERRDGRTLDALHERRIAARHRMGDSRRADGQQAGEGEQDPDCRSAHCTLAMVGSYLAWQFVQTA